MMFQALPTVIELSLGLLDNSGTRSLALANLESLINAVLYNPAAALHIMEQTKPGAARTFFDKWFASLKLPSGLPRVHDKKLSIVTLCALLELDPSSIPASLQDGWTAIVSAILHVFQGLPEAIESKLYIIHIFCVYLLKFTCCVIERKVLEDAYKVDSDDEDGDLTGNDVLNLEDNDGMRSLYTAYP